MTKIKSTFKKLNKRPFLVLVTFLFLSIATFNYENKVYSIHFVDEEDNIVLGNFLLKGEKLYLDLFSHHQPLAYVLSAGVTKITHPNSIASLIKRHREAVMIWSFIWSMILVLRFGYSAAFFVVVYELFKIFLLGNLFLSESLVVYPLAYLSFIGLERRVVKSIECILIGLLFGLTIFLLAPIWPLAFALMGIIFFGNRKKIMNKIGFSLIGFLPVLILSFYFSGVRDYFFNVFYINFTYYIPKDRVESPLITIVRSFLTPLISFLPSEQTGASLTLIRTLSPPLNGFLSDE